MTDIKTLKETLWSGSNDSTFIAASGSYIQQEPIFSDEELKEGVHEKIFVLFKEKIDELVKEVNILKNK